MLLIEAVQQGRTKQLKLLIKVGIDVNQIDALGQTALVHSCFVQNSKLRQAAIKTLVSSGSADINKRDIFGRSALSWACLHGHEDTVDFLLNSPPCQFDIEVDVSDKDGNSLLLLAVMSNSFPVVQLVLGVLRETGSSACHMHRVNNAGISPLVLAFLRGDKKCSALLIKDGSASVSSVLQYVKQSENQQSSPFSSPQVAWMPPRGVVTSTTAARHQQTGFSLKNVTEDDVLQFLFAESKSTAVAADKARVNKKSIGEVSSQDCSKDSAVSTCAVVAGPIARSSRCVSSREKADSLHSSSSDRRDVCTKSTAMKLSRKQTYGSSSRQESPILKLFALYSEVQSPSYRQGYPVVHYQPSPEILEQPLSTDLLDVSRGEGVRSSRGGNSSSGDDVFDESKESAMDKHLRLKYARSSRAASLQVDKLPPIGLPGLRPAARMKRTRSSAAIKRF